MNRKIMVVMLLFVSTASASAADLTITAANVKILSTTTKTLNVQFGEIVTAGQAVYRKAADGKYWKADNDVDAATSTVVGIVLQGGSADAYGVVVTSGEMDLGATLAAGMAYVLSSTAGGIAPVADLGTADYITHLGYATTSGKFVIGFKNHLVQKP